MEMATLFWQEQNQSRNNLETASILAPDDDSLTQINLQAVTVFFGPFLSAQQMDLQRFLFLCGLLFEWTNQDRLLQSVQWVWGLIKEREWIITKCQDATAAHSTFFMGRKNENILSDKFSPQIFAPLLTQRQFQRSFLFQNWHLDYNFELTMGTERG